MRLYHLEMMALQVPDDRLLRFQKQKSFMSCHASHFMSKILFFRLQVLQNTNKASLRK